MASPHFHEALWFLVDWPARERAADLVTTRARDPTERAIDIVASGHSYRPKADTVDGVLYLNPGSAGPRRFRLPITLATIDLTHDAIRPVIHELNP